ncbi:MAG: hypothetical protein ACLRZH_16240 [Ruthenibacterium lactatiformans]
MALHVSPEILEQYHGFTALRWTARRMTAARWCWRMCLPRACAPPEAVSEPDALRTVLIKSCPELQSLSFLENFPALEWCMCAAARRWPRCGIPRARPRCGALL